jgi:hypothetical protein
VFLHLPVGRSNTVRVLLVLSALTTAGCVLWIRDLRYSGEMHGLSPIFFALFTYFDYLSAMVALGILVGAVLVPALSGFDRLLRWLGTHPLIVASIVTVLLSIGTLKIYQNHPLSMDEYAPLFQSRIFAAGHLTGQVPPDLLDFVVPPENQNFFLNISRATGQVTSSYWPGFALLLTPFTILGISWACNAVLSGLTLIVLNRLALRLFGTIEAAGLVMLLTMASPVFFADGISFYSMTSHMLANALFALLLLEPSTKRLVAAGVVGSIALSLHNPVPHVLFAIPWFVWLATQDKPFGKLVALCAGYLPLSLVIVVGWFVFSGHLVHDGAPATSGVGSMSNVATAFAWPDARLFYARAVGLAKVLLWAAPCVFILAFAGAWSGRRDSRLVTLAASGLLTFVGFLFVAPDQGHGWGFRYFHSAWLVLPVLTTAFIVSISPELRVGRTEAPAKEGTETRAFVVACALLSLVFGVGLRASQIREFVNDQLGQLPRYTGTEPRVVVIEADKGFYALDLVQNDPFLRDSVVNFVQLNPKATAAALHAHYPTYQLVFQDERGQVWSEARTASR